jgi:hypothetical protein
MLYQLDKDLEKTSGEVRLLRTPLLIPNKQKIMENHIVK